MTNAFLLDMMDRIERTEQAAAERVARGTSASDFFVEMPVPLTTFIQDKKFLANPALGPKQLDYLRHAERIYLPETYGLLAAEDDGGYWADPVRMTNTFTLQWGKGSGKDHLCRMTTLRIAYLLLCLKDPKEYFGMPAQDTIHMLNIASSSAQALNAFFTPLTKAVRRGWFADKADPKADMIVFDKDVEAISGHSDAESQEGLNLILGVADEIDAFRTKAEIERYRGKAARESPRSATSIMKMLKTSASTRFPQTYKTVRISYPRYKGSTIQQLTAQAKLDNETQGETSRHYVSGPWATWDVNPRVRSKDDFADDYRTDPVTARAMYECDPSTATNAYFKRMETFRSAVVGDQPVSVRYELVEAPSIVDPTRAVRNWDAVFDFADGFVPIEGADYAIHIDQALTGDRAGVAMSHVVRYQTTTAALETEDGSLEERTVSRPVVRNDFTFSFESALGEVPREIQIRWGRVLCLELLRRGFHVGSFSYDGFQSADSLQLLASWGIEAKKFSTDKTDIVWKTLKDVAYDNRLTLPHSDLLLMELEGLNEADGRIDHLHGASKDLADAFGCSVYGAVLLGGQEDEDRRVAYAGGNAFEMGVAPDFGFGVNGFELGSPGLLEPPGM